MNPSLSQSLAPSSQRKDWNHDTAMKLDHGQLHIMRLAQRGKSADGWARVSALVWPLLATVPKELVELKQEPGDDGGFCKLTPEGETVLEWS